MSRIGSLLRHAALVKRDTGKSRVRQLSEILSLAVGERRLGMTEYYEFGVFDDNAYPAQKKADCVGWRSSGKIDLRLNHPYWRAVANDKLLNYALLQHYGFPIPKTIACYSPQGRRVGGETLLRNRQELEAYLRQDVQFPVFIKPIHGSYGRGTYLLESFDAVSGSFVGANNKSVPMPELLDACLFEKFNGMLFQQCLKPHPDVRALTGHTTSCVRLIIAMTAQGPKVHMAFWKIARSHNITDNFCMGETGNLLAWVNKASGTIERVVTGLWPDGKEVTQHPDTGQTLVGASLPQWQEALALALAAAVHFPGLRLQHWDVAFCEDGPVLMELNTEADLAVPQYLGRTPFIDQTIREMM
ncbi:MAG: sugar-transfer associated ATP-grasp domain-containing protein [Gammaproteobacteria bacterium]|nr:sugar-transfer associated ATP-grasp domain-containing protein [Gammaproteobacteria bacterium]